MRRFAGPVLAVVFLVTTASAEARGCVLGKGERVVKSSDRAVVIASPRGRGTVAYRACWRASGRTTELGQSYRTFDGGSRIGPFALAGRWVAFGDGHTDRYDSFTEVLRIDVRTGRGRRQWTPAPPQAQPPELFTSGIRAVAVNEAGRVAWIASSYVGDAVDVSQGSAMRRVDVGFPRALTAPAFAESVLTWRHGDLARSSALPEACARRAGLRRLEYRGDLVLAENHHAQLFGCEQTEGVWRLLGTTGSVLDAAGVFAVVASGGYFDLYDIASGVRVGERIAGATSAAAFVDEHGSLAWEDHRDGGTSIWTRDGFGVRRLAGPDPFVWRLARDGSRLRWDAGDRHGEATMTPT